MVFPDLNIKRETWLQRKRRKEQINYYIDEEKEEKIMKYGKKFGYKCRTKSCKYRGSSRSARVCPSCGVKDPFAKRKI